jgi:hypothetical protein
MDFALLTQDGHEEGAFILDRDPTPVEASIIRKYVGLRKKMDLSPEVLAAKRESGKALAERRSAA